MENGQIKFNSDQGFPSPGFRLGFPIVQSKFQNQDTGIWSYLMITPSGGRVELRQVGTTNTYEAYDGSYSQLIDNGTSGLIVRMRDGSQLTFTSAGTSAGSSFVCTEIKDRNGNYLSVSYNGLQPLTVTDTAGRVINFNYDSGFLVCDSRRNSYSRNPHHIWPETDSAARSGDTLMARRN